jgi:hypothetical protein
LPTLYLFGSPSKEERRFYHDFKLTYRPSLVHFSEARNKEVGVAPDTMTVRTRKHWTRIDHSPTLYLPTMKLGPYLNVVPKVTYKETWARVYQTDQSDSAGVPAGNYRSYQYGASASANTKLYGTVYPNMFGLVGLRHVITPTLSYTWTPRIDNLPLAFGYVPGMAGTTRTSQRLGVSLGQDFMAKVRKGESEQSINLLSISSSFSYDFEAEERPYSNLTTSFRSSAIPGITFNGSMTHSFYEPGTDNLKFWSPYLEAFSLTTQFKISGPFPLFDEDEGRSIRVTDTVSGGPSGTGNQASGKKSHWDATFSYRYSESGRGSNYRKSPLSLFVDLSLSANLTTTTQLSYTQRFDFDKGRTVNNSVRISKQIHCWTGSLWWVPAGSNAGFGFKLHVTALPEIKIDNGHDSFMSSVGRYR